MKINLRIVSTLFPYISLITNKEFPDLQIFILNHRVYFWIDPCIFYIYNLEFVSGKGPIQGSFIMAAIKGKRSDPKNISGPDFVWTTMVGAPNACNESISYKLSILKQAMRTPCSIASPVVFFKDSLTSVLSISFRHFSISESVILAFFAASFRLSFSTMSSPLLETNF